jgi:hypothetical protein
MGILPQQAHPSSPLDVAVELGTIEIMWLWKSPTNAHMHKDHQCKPKS